MIQRPLAFRWSLWAGRARPRRCGPPQVSLRRLGGSHTSGRTHGPLSYQASESLANPRAK